MIGFVMSLGYANLLTPETYGTYRYLLSAYSLVAILALPGIDTAIIQSIGQGFDSSFLRGLRLKLRWGILGMIACVGVGFYYLLKQDQHMALLFGISAVFLPFMEAGSLSPSYFNAKKDYRRWALFDLVTQITTAMILLGSMFLFHQTLYLVIAYFGGNVLMRWIILWIIHREQKASSQKMEAIDHGLSPYARSLTLFQITSRVISSIDGIVLFHFLGPAQLAIYTIALAIPARAQGMFRILGSLAFPKFANRPAHKVAGVLSKKMLMMAVGVIIICFAYVGIAPWLFRTFLPKYIPSVPYSQLFVFSLISSITYPMSSFLFTHKRIKENYLLSWSSLTVKIVCLIAFVPLFGIWGAVISALGASLTTTSLCFVLLYRETRRADSKDDSDPNIDTQSIDQSIGAGTGSSM